MPQKDIINSIIFFSTIPFYILFTIVFPIKKKKIGSLKRAGIGRFLPFLSLLSRLSFLEIKKIFFKIYFCSKEAKTLLIYQFIIQIVK